MVRRNSGGIVEIVVDGNWEEIRWNPPGFAISADLERDASVPHRPNEPKYPLHGTSFRAGP